MLQHFHDAFPQLRITPMIRQWVKQNPRIAWVMAKLGGNNPLVVHALGWLNKCGYLHPNLVIYFWQRAGKEEGLDCDVPSVLTTLASLVTASPDELTLSFDTETASLDQAYQQGTVVGIAVTITPEKLDVKVAKSV